MSVTMYLKIFGAYSYRLTRKHSTVLLIILFILILSTILQLYANKHQETQNFAVKVGDYDYVPGTFLRGKQPCENTTYCQFNYGLPKAIEWRYIREVPPPEGGKASSYRVIYNAIHGTAYENYSQYDALTYATQATPEFLYHITEIAKYWDGPISLAVFVPDFDMDLTMQIMSQLCSCFAAMSKVSLHLFYPIRYRPKIRIHDPFYPTTDVPTTTPNITTQELLKQREERYRLLNNQTRAEYVEWVRKKKVERMMARIPKRQLFVPQLIFDDCAGFDLFDIPTFRRENDLDYPINVGRNVARNASKTNFFIVSDIELVPSDGLATKYLAFVRKVMGDKRREEGQIFYKAIFVVPLFEVDRGVEIPRDKDTLIRLINENRARYFHQKLCAHCQRFPGLQTWLKRPAPKDIQLMLITRREYPYHRWEPLYFGCRKEPWYSEQLSWEGRQDKMTQMLEMCLLDYAMAILDGAFLCHAASSRNVSRDNRAERINHRRYQTIISSLKEKYGNKPKCKLMYGY